MSGIQPGFVAFDDPGLLETPVAPVGLRGREPRGFGKFEVGGAAVFLQVIEEATVGGVDREGSQFALLLLSQRV